MSLTSFVVSRSWASNWLRTALTVLGIALGVAIVVAIYVMDHNTIQSRFRQQQQDRGQVDLEVVPPDDRDRDAVVADLLAIEGVQAAASWRETEVVLTTGDGRQALAATFGLSSHAGSAFQHYVVEQGRDLDPAASLPGVLVGSETARRLGLAVGQSLRLARPPTPRFECRDGQLVRIGSDEVEAFSAEVVVRGVLAPVRLGRHAQGEVLVCSHDLARRLPGKGRDRYHLQRVYGADLDRIRGELSDRGYVVVDGRSAMIGEGADERAFRNGLKILGCLALLLGMFVVFQTLSHSLVARVRLLGLLRCLGAGRGVVGRIFLGDALLMGIVGSALGLVLGIVLAWLLRAFDISSLGAGKSWHTFELPLLPMAWTAGLGVLFTLAGAAFPLWRARQLPALWILRQRGIGAGEGEDDDLLRGVNVWLFVLLVGVLPLAYLAMTPLVAEEGRETLYVLLEMGGMVAMIGGLLLLAPVCLAVLGRLILLPVRPVAPLSAWLCSKAIERQPGRTAAAVVGLAAVLVALLGLKSITASLRGDVQQFAEGALRDRAFAEMPERTVEQCRPLLDLPGVVGYEAIEGEVRDVGFLLRGVSLDAAAAAGGALEGQPELARRYSDRRVRTMIVSRRLALKMGWSAGRTMVPMLDRNREPVVYKVLVVSDATGYVPSDQAWATTSPYWMKKDFCIGEQCVRYVTLQLAADADSDFVGDRLRTLEPRLVRYKPGYFIRDYHLRDVNRDFYLFDLLLVLILGLAGTGLLNGMTIAAMGRARELGVLRALGVSRRTIAGSMLLEGLVVGALSAVLALGLAWPMAHVLVLGLNRVAALDAPVVMPWPWLFVVPPVALLTGALAAWLPAWRSVRQDPAASVRYE